jgi:hypothetical protein
MSDRRESDGRSAHWTSHAQVQAFADGTLSADVVAERTAHLVDCGDCREELARLRDGLQVELSDDERAAYDEQATGDSDALFQEIVERAEEDRGALVGDRIREWLQRPRMIWGSAGIVTAVAMAVFLILPHVTTEASRRGDLDALYARAGAGFPIWTGSPGRLVQPFLTPPAEPVRGAYVAQPNALAEIQSVEDALLGLDLSREDEDFERSVAVAMLRLSRGEVESAWSILEPTVVEYRTTQSLSALACAALASGDPQKMRAASEALTSGRHEEIVVLYDLVLLHHFLGESGAARRALSRYRDRVGPADPWLSQLEAAVGF